LNFVVNRKRAFELAEQMSRAGLQMVYSAQVRADVGRDRKLLAALKRSGCRAVYVGLETVNQAALDDSGKRQQVERMTEHIHNIRDAGIGVHGMFVLGFDHDDPSTIQATIDYACTCGISSVQLMILVPLPGSEIARQIEEQGRLRTTDWNLYDAHHVVFAPRQLTPWQLQSAQVEGHRRFYSLSNARLFLYGDITTEDQLAFLAGRLVGERYDAASGNGPCRHIH